MSLTQSKVSRIFVCNRGTQFCVTADSTLIYINANEGVRPIKESFSGGLEPLFFFIKQIKETNVFALCSAKDANTNFD